MANLKGGTYEKQIKDAFHRLEAFGEKRHGKDDHLTHSDKLAEKREMYLRDVAEHFEINNFNEKLNVLFTQENLQTFFSERLDGLAAKTQEDYLRGFSSMLKGLEEQNIFIPLHIENGDFFNDYVSQVKDQADTILENRYIENASDIINHLYEDRYITGLIAETQLTLGIRQAEAFELILNSEKYIENGTVSDLVGKGNHTYGEKEIPFELEQKILTYEGDLIDKSTYYRDLQEYHISSHDLRFTYARDTYEEKISEGLSEREAKLHVSEELNHKRESITDYYLSRTQD
jgi:hypothetical protein